MSSVLPMVYFEVMAASVQVIGVSSVYMISFVGREPLRMYSVPMTATWHKEMSNPSSQENTSV